MVKPWQQSDTRRLSSPSRDTLRLEAVVLGHVRFRKPLLHEACLLGVHEAVLRLGGVDLEPFHQI